MSFVQNHKTKKRKTQFAFCYLHVDLKRDAFPTYPSYPLPTSLTLAQPQTGGLCMLRNIDLDAARCIGMRHSDTATTPSIKPKGDGWGMWIFDFPQKNTMKQTEAAQCSHTETWRNITPTHPPCAHLVIIILILILILWGHGVMLAEDSECVWGSQS